MLMGPSQPVDGGISVGQNYRFSSRGTNYIARARLDDPPNFDNVVARNGAVVVADGLPLREGGLLSMDLAVENGERWTNFANQVINERGRALVAAVTNASSSENDVLLRDSEILLREGDVLGIGSELAPLVDQVAVPDQNDGGDWAALWRVQATTGTLEVLILNGQVVLKEGDLVDWNNDGAIDAADQDATLTNLIQTSDVSLSRRSPDGDVSIYFVADVELNGTTTKRGFFCLTIPGELCAGDTDGSGVVDIDDVVNVVLDFGTPGVNNGGDVDFNGIVDIDDIVVTVLNFGPCPGT
jgi:hypothetical protein